MMGALWSLRNTENFSKCCEQFVQYLLKYNVIWRSHGLLPLCHLFIFKKFSHYWKWASRILHALNLFEVRSR